MKLDRVLPVWTVYHNADDVDYPFVARLSLSGDNAICHTQHVFVADTLEQIRAKLPDGLALIPRQAGDDPVIVECWL